jgi:transposase-like protein
MGVVTKPLSCDQVQAVLGSYDTGISVAQIASAQGISINAVYRHLHKHGRIVTKRAPSYKMSPEQVQTVNECYKNGMDPPEISARVGVPYRPLCGWMSAHHMPSRRWHKAAPIVREDGQMFCVHCESWKPSDAFRKHVTRKGRVRFFQARLCGKCADLKHIEQVNGDPRRVFGRICNRVRKIDPACDLDVAYLTGLYAKQQGKCFYTDLPLPCRLRPYHERKQSLSVDRIVPGRGYMKGNVVLTSFRINSLKSDATLDEMRCWMPDWHSRIINCKWLSL